MRVKASVFVLLAVVAVAVSAASRDGTQAFNVLLSDEDSGFLSGCTEVRIYAIDPVLGTRQSEDPVAVLSHPASPIELALEPGRYELAIWMLPSIRGLVHGVRRRRGWRERIQCDDGRAPGGASDVLR